MAPTSQPLWGLAFPVVAFLMPWTLSCRLTIYQAPNRMVNRAEQLAMCCGSSKWVRVMIETECEEEDLIAQADQAFEKLEREDWLEAFSAHPKIGDVSSLKAKFANTKQLASGEQAGAAEADDTTLNELASMNERYLERFGYIFIVCATGKSANEMLDILKSRIDNGPEEELKIAAENQKMITRIRLQKSFSRRP